MKLNSITNRYILKEMLVPFSINIFIFAFLFLMTEMIEIANWIVNYNLSLWAVLTLVIYTLPSFLIFIIPMSVMLAILLTFLRLSSDNEIVAIKSCGMSIYGLLPPVLLFALFGFVLTIFMTLYGAPRSKASLEEMALKVATTNLDIGLKERTFNDTFEGVMLYVNEIDIKNKKLIDVFIEDKRQPDVVSTVIAPAGRLIGEPEKYLYHLILSNGTIHQTNPKEHSANAIQFNTYTLSLNFKDQVANAAKRKKKRDEMSGTELRRYIEHMKDRDEEAYNKAKITLHRRYSIPAACLALGLLAFPLGIQSKTTPRSFGLILCLFFFFVYYLLLTAGYSFGKSGVYPPVVGMWLPNFVMTGIGLFFLFQTARDRSLKLDLLAKRIQLILDRFRRLERAR
ncbi:MAG: LPS export ABC transporter permease LptF [Deltaproteobacteria bacterium]|jgi:lipopolysaccharide export system permease protein|nr:LPS export ABC transporter permease LptF [Deltaproteobacteria bacterium]